ncbi:MAG: carboxypeptidase M32 [Gammaproteobacteria bacterium]|nr:carboxypeptidase M32 [Gammaproteobacteria bacterium]
MSAYQQLEKIFTKLSHLNHLQAITGWDEAVMMPPGGGKARAKALATLGIIQHETMTQPQIKDLIEQAKQQDLSSPWQTTNLKLIEKQYINANCLPTELVGKLTQSRIECEQAWRTMRADNNWKDFAPLLDKVLKLTKESAVIRSQAMQMSPFDVLIDEFAPDMTQKQIDPIFDALKRTLPPLIKQIIAKQQQHQQVALKGPFNTEQQKKLGLTLMKTIGFDFNHGRLDVSHHPFCGGVAQDVRITTRYNKHEFISSAMGTCHETGHACYEQGLPLQWLEQPVGMAQGIAMHESQSLLIEMQACRCPAFMQYLAPLLTEHFGPHDAFTPDNLFRLYTAVKPGLIRVDADEVSYPLHVILRYELEKSLIEGDMTVADLPDAWNEKMQHYFNLSTAGNDKDGVMQDVHWPSAAFGYFPSYTLGSLIAAQLFQSALKQHPNIPQQLGQGNFTALLQWLRKNIHSKGSSLTTSQLLTNVTGEDLNPDYFLQHIKDRYLNGD